MPLPLSQQNELDAECGVGQITLEGEVTELAEISCNVGEVMMYPAGDSRRL